MTTVVLVLSALATVVILGLITLHFLLVIFTPHPTPGNPSEKSYTTTPSSTPLPLPTLAEGPSKGISVVIPAYNEDDRLGIMVDEVMEYFLAVEKLNTKEDAEEGSARKRVVRRTQGGVEVIIVDDGSTDRTTQTAQALVKKWEERITDAKVELRVVTLRRNRGKGGAVQHGVNHSRGELVLFADADGATRFADLDDLLKAMDEIKDQDGHGIVVGSRAHLVKSEAVVKRSMVRNALMYGFHFFLRTIGVDGIRDTQCGFKLFTRPTAALLFPTLHLHRWSFDVELLLLASLVEPTVPVKEVPVAWHEVNGSKIRLGWDSIGMARDLLVLRGNLFTGRWVVPRRPQTQAPETETETETKVPKVNGVIESKKA